MIALVLIIAMLSLTPMHSISFKYSMVLMIALKYSMGVNDSISFKYSMLNDSLKLMLSL